MLVVHDVARPPPSCVEVVRGPYGVVVVERQAEVRVELSADVRPLEVGTLEVRVGENGPYEVRLAQPGPFEVRVVEPGVFEVRLVEDGPFEVCAFPCIKYERPQVCTSEVERLVLSILGDVSTREDTHHGLDIGWEWRRFAFLALVSRVLSNVGREHLDDLRVIVL